jgi:hypothetical protein
MEKGKTKKGILDKRKNIMNGFANNGECHVAPGSFTLFVINPPFMSFKLFIVYLAQHGIRRCSQIRS